MPRLIPCPGCARHVRASSSLCPFCEASVLAPPAPAPRVLPRSRITRVALLAGATWLASACGGPQQETGAPPYGAPGDPDESSLGVPEDPEEGSGGSEEEAREPDPGPEEGAVVPLYGGPSMREAATLEDER